MQFTSKEPISNLILAESGGNKTSWYVRKNGKQFLDMEGPSLHPEYWRENYANRIPSEILNLETENFDLVFFGAGCLREKPQLEFQKWISTLKFKSVTVAGDVVAAVLACANGEVGWYAILGSGSVIMHYNGREIDQLAGGNGANDDFGSGRRFGRMIEEEMKNNSSYLHVFKDQLAGLPSIEYSRVLPKAEVVAFHSRNIDLFVDQLVGNHVPTRACIHFAGGYAAHVQPELESALRKKGYLLGNLVAKPMENLIKLF